MIVPSCFHPKSRTVCCAVRLFKFNIFCNKIFHLWATRIPQTFLFKHHTNEFFTNQLIRLLMTASNTLVFIFLFIQSLQFTQSNAFFRCVSPSLTYLISFTHKCLFLHSLSLTHFILVSLFIYFTQSALFTHLDSLVSHTFLVSLSLSHSLSLSLHLVSLFI